MTTIPILDHQITFAEKSLKGKYCLSPFVMIEIDIGGNVRLCGCGSWMPATIGNLTTNTLPEILSSNLAKKIRSSIINGTYQYCNEVHCGIMANDGLNEFDTLPENVKSLLEDPSKFEMPHWISIQGDNICNLSCPSCRTGIIKPSKKQAVYREKMGKIISSNLFSQATDKKIVVHLSGSGEVFASPLLLNLLSTIDIVKFPKFELCLQTNGLLAKKNWHKILHLESTIQHVVVSIDAATAPTYEIIRRGGSWGKLISALKFLQDKQSQLGFELRTRMVVQNLNVNEIEKFYHFSKSYGATRIEYAKITNWYTWDQKQFNQQNVFDVTHENYNHTFNEINKVKNLPGAWCHGLF